jgi:predicted nucleic-acid-binding Zn-ribbon protein
MGLFKKIKSNEPIQVEIHGKIFQCTACNNDRFWKDEAQVNNWFTTFLGLDWIDRSAIYLVCDNCGYMHWFRPELISYKNIEKD